MQNLAQTGNRSVIDGVEVALRRGSLLHASDINSSTFYWAGKKETKATIQPIRIFFDHYLDKIAWAHFVFRKGDEASGEPAECTDSVIMYFNRDTKKHTATIPIGPATPEAKQKSYSSFFLPEEFESALKEFLNREAPSEWFKHELKVR
ncbi:MAG: hypothetical protein KGI04_02700 [Candidatus Micrarchaeota archaeon]|nr:hypothetical protein [Candidatus Micrarchaeota archaeon]